MEEIPISRFKATCLAVLERVRSSGEPVLVTRFGHPVAQISRPPRNSARKRKLGDLAGTAHIVGDIVAPAADEGDYDVLR